MNVEILDVIETAKYLKLSTKKVYQLIKSNAIPFKKIGGQYRFVKSQVDNWVGKEGVEAKVEGKVEVEVETTDNKYPVRNAVSANEQGLKQLIEKAKTITDKLKRQLFVVGIFTRELKKHNLKPVVVGGFAVEFYTAGGYNTGDIDLVFSDNVLLGEILSGMGFVKSGRHWVNKELEVYVEAPGSRLTAGEIEHLVEVEIEGLKTYFIGIEDLLIDRLNALVHWKSEDEANWVKELLLINYKNMDWQYLETRALEEKTYSVLFDLKKEAENAKNKL
jgi:excisionase family DNA binding protein